MNVMPLAHEWTNGKTLYWLGECIANDAGKSLPILANALIALRADPGLCNAFAYDEMGRAPMLLHDIGDPLSVSECGRSPDIGRNGCRRIGP
jgi:hypothetical protein